jgi:PAS domain S-box-containing protein
MNQTIDSQAMQLRVLDASLGSVQDGVIVLSPDLKVLRINLAAETIFGYKNRDAAHQPINLMLIGSEQVLSALNLAQKGSPTYHLNNIQLLRRYGDSFQALIRIQPIIYQGEVESIVVVGRDLSEQAAYEAHARLLAQNAELGEVMAAFAHEVRNPINNISSGLQVMERTLPESDPQREEVRMLLLDVDRVAELMKSMLSVTRTSDLKPRPTDLGILVSSLVDRLRPSIKREGISCQANIESGLPQIYGDGRALEQVFNNLIRNAIQAMKGRPESQLIVKVQALKAAKERMFVEVSIADNGPGIPKENQDKIFQPFFTTKTDGNGLGLPLAKRIITAHRGSISVTSFPGGTVFKVTLPALDRARQTGPLPALEDRPEEQPSPPVVENNP